MTRQLHGCLRLLLLNMHRMCLLLQQLVVLGRGTARWTWLRRLWAFGEAILEDEDAGAGELD